MPVRVVIQMVPERAMFNPVMDSSVRPSRIVYDLNCWPVQRFSPALPPTQT